jgi:two-component system phosphate regulon sensor histidine kinase PhoR
MIKCDISDQGIGIARENIPRLFEKFYRVDNSDVYEISGTGLGLSIVKHIIDSHGGDISVTSEVGKGSTFSMLLPFHRN